MQNLYRLKFDSPWMQESFRRILEEYDFLTEQIALQTKLLKASAETPLYAERVKILITYPGLGPIAAMELLVELQDVERFRKAGVSKHQRRGD